MNKIWKNVRTGSRIHAIGSAILSTKNSVFDGEPLMLCVDTLGNQIAVPVSSLETDEYEAITYLPDEVNKRLSKALEMLDERRVGGHPDKGNPDPVFQRLYDLVLLVKNDTDAALPAIMPTRQTGKRRTQ